MKYCPTCRTDYTDDSLQFCLQDGDRLISYEGGSSQMPTQVLGEAETVIQQSRKTSGWGQSQMTRLSPPISPPVYPPLPQERKSSAHLAAGLAAVAVFLLLGGSVGVWLLLRSGKNSTDTNHNRDFPSPSPTKTVAVTPNVTPWVDGNRNGGTIIDLPKSGEFIGCFRDTPVFDLNGYLERSDKNTPERCVATCRAKGFRYAGVQFGESCLCGNSYGRYGAATNCDYKCTGDANQICGGYNANSVYSTGALQSCNHVLGASINEKWKQMGGEGSTLGCPIIDETDAGPSPYGTTGRMTQFAKGDGGYIILHGSGSFAGTAFEVSGCMFKLYASQGGTKSWLGFPIRDGYQTPTGARQDFEGGFILWDSKTYQCQAYKNPQGV